MEQVQLKPCPFCGGEANMSKYEVDFCGRPTWVKEEANKK